MLVGLFCVSPNFIAQLIGWFQMEREAWLLKPPSLRFFWISASALVLLPDRAGSNSQDARRAIRPRAVSCRGLWGWVARFVLWHYASVTPETSSKRARTCRDVPRGTITQTQGNRKVGPSVRCCRQWPSTTEVYKEYAQVGRRNAADARGLAQRAGTHLGQFLPRFKRERGNVGVIRSFC